MTAFRGKNFRSGDLAEQMGVLLLQNVALVAQVPRTEDVGIDVVATLIRHFDRYNYIAEDSFFVQIKSSSETEIIFKDKQVQWLSELQLPFFVALVDRKKTTIYLYCAHYLSDVLVTNPNRNEIILDLKDTSSDYDCCNKEECVRIPLGPCIISWSFNNFEKNDDFIAVFYKLIKAHILAAKRSIETRRVGVAELVSWETGAEPVLREIKINPVKNTRESEKIIAPYFQALLQNIIIGDDLLTTRSLYRLLEANLEDKGQFKMVEGEKVLIPFDAALEE